LLVRAEVQDAAMSRTERLWTGSAVELFFAALGEDRITQIYLLPEVGDHPAEALLVKPGGPVALPGVSIASSYTADGYVIEARIPLELAGLAADAAGLRLEAQVGYLLQPGGRRRHGTLFGSVMAYQNAGRYAHFQLERTGKHYWNGVSGSKSGSNRLD